METELSSLLVVDPGSLCLGFRCGGDRIRTQLLTFCLGFIARRLGLLSSGLLLLLLDLEEQGAVDVGKNTTEGDGGADQRIELFVTTDGKLQVARGDALDLEILGSVLRR